MTKFIKIRGRIIPIRDKGEDVKKYEKRLTKADMKTGFAVGLTQSLFFKKKPVAIATALASLTQGAGTTVKRYQNHGILRATWEDTKSSWLKAGSALVGAGLGTGSLIGLNKLNQMRKASQIKKAAKASVKIAGLLK